MAIYELGEDRRKTNLSALLEAAALGLKARQMGSENAYYKGMGQYYGAAGKMLDLQNQMEEKARRDALFGIPQPPVGAVPPQVATPQFGQSPQQNMVVKSMTVDPIQQTVSQTFGQSPESEADLQVKTQNRKDILGRMGKLGELIPLLDNFEAQLDAIPVGKGASGKLQGISAKLQGSLNSDPFAASTMSQLDALRPQIARAFGDVGNLSQAEQAAAKKFMPDVSDSADTRAVKIVSALGFLKRKLESGAKDAKVIDSPEYQQKFGLLNERVKMALKKALISGASSKRLREFAGADVLRSLGVRKFKTESEAIKAGLSDGDLVDVGGQLAIWEE